MPDSDEQSGRTRVRPVDPRLLRYASAARGFFVAIALIGVLQTLVIVAFAWLVTALITGVVAGRTWSELSPLLAWLAVVVLARGLLLWLREVACARAAARVEAQLRARLLDAIGCLGPGWLAGRNTARLAVTAGRGLETLDTYFSRYLPQLVLTMIATPIIVAVMWWQDWISGLTVLLTIPLIPLFMVLIGLATRSVQQQQWRTLGTLAARFADTVQGLSTLKIFGRQHRAAASIERVTGAYRTETMRVLRVSFLSGFALELLASISVAIIAVSIGFRLIDASLGLAVGLFVLLLAPEAYLPLRQVGVQFHAAAEGVAATEDLFDVLDAAALASAPASPARSSAARSAAASRAEGMPRAEGAPRAFGPPPVASPPLGTRSGTLDVRRLRVHRGDHHLAPVDFTATPGTVTLIEGPSGSGKSSLLAALRGAADFDGTAEYDGTDVRSLAPSSWLAWAGQQPGLITGTIAANVALGDELADSAAAADDPLVRRALALAPAADLEPSRVLGVQGAGLSGGQAQRVAVARAFFRHLRGRAPVIALDEPSAALDPATEADLWASVRALADAGATVVLVSHRTTARDIADQVVRLSGHAVEVTA